MCKKYQPINRPLTPEEREKIREDNITEAVQIQKGIISDMKEYLSLLPEIKECSELVRQYPLSDQSYYYSIGFIAGYNHRINKMWHDPSEKPVLNQFFVYCDENGYYETDYFYKELILTGNWEDYVAVNKLKRWAYMKDLIPKMD